MDKVLQNITTIINAAVDKKPIKKFQFTGNEYIAIHDRIVDLYNLIAFTNNDALSDEKIVRDMVLNNRFIERNFVIGTPEYADFVRKVSQLKDIKDGQRIVLPPNPNDKASAKKSYQFIRRGNIVTQYSILHSLRDSNTVSDTNWSMDVLRTHPGVETVGDKMYFKVQLPNGVKSVTAFKDKNGVVNTVAYDDRVNPFDTEHVLLFDVNGKRLPLQNENLVKLIKLVRHSVAHHRIYNYLPNTASQGKVFKLNDGRVFACSSSWFARLVSPYQVCTSSKSSKISKFFVSLGDAPVRNAEQLKSKLENECFVVTAYDCYPEQETEVLDRVMEAIMQQYGAVQKTIKQTPHEYFHNQLMQALQLKSCSISVSKTNNYAQLINRILPACDPASCQKFFNLASNAKENRDAQNKILSDLINNFYSVEAISATPLGQNNDSKFVSVLIDLKNLSDCYDEDLTVAYNSAMGIQYKPNLLVAPPERYLGLCITSIYSSLITNNLFDKLNDLYPKYRDSYALDMDSADQKLLSMLNDINMDAFEIHKNTRTQKEVKKPKTIDDKMIVLRAMRNAVCHNGVSIKQNRTGDFKQNTLSFVNEIGRSFVVAEEQDIVALFNNSLFDWGSSEYKLLAASNNQEFMQQIEMLANNKVSDFEDEVEFE